MKYKALLIAAISFFIVINSIYLLHDKLGLLIMPILMILFLAYCGLGLEFILQLYFAKQEQFSDKYRLFVIGVLGVVLIITYYYPLGLFRPKQSDEHDLLLAEREGAANCMTTLRLKDDFSFIERNVCFGVTELKGNYRLQHDTIYFKYLEPAQTNDTPYEFATIRPLESSNSQYKFILIRYKNQQDSVGHELGVKINKLPK